ncbi:MAG TPA: multicopper oxidase domain-containing protein [Jatrophihabitans sp.]|nr:multicopper oxidase domain-containing protein [Jatrophihabitans sp.]
MIGTAALVAGLTVAPAGAAARPAPPTAGSIRLTAATPSAVGHLAVSACATGATAACDLYAKAGSTQMPGALAATPIWGFAANNSDPVTTPGPLLVVRQNQQVTITVHNGLAEPLALALPGQASVNEGTGDDRTGAAVGGTKSYTFTASRPGSFLYEAGHTADGARQIAMGLAGGLIVLPADGTGYGSPATAYDDDAVLVMSEIDPALNSSPDPLSFDMRNYKPAYRLLNGHPFPSATSSIATDSGHKVLVRYINVGGQLHSMATLGAAQVEVADDGHPLQYPLTHTVEPVQPGQTLDTVVSMPTVTGSPQSASKVTLYEANGALDNANGLTADTPAQVAFGGMLAFLDTNVAPDLTHDVVGPTAKAISASPNPSDALADVTVSATISDASTGGSGITAAEYVIDDTAANPVAPSTGTPMTLASPNQVSTTATGTIPAGVLAAPTFQAGRHIVYVRGKDAAGNWGLVGSAVLNVPKAGPATVNGSVTPAITNASAPIDISATGDDSLAGGNVVAAEYFLDNPPATADNGHGTPMTVNRAASVVSVDATIDPAAAGAPVLTEGAHHVYVHVKDNLNGAGLWGPVLDIPLTVDKTGPSTQGSAVSPPYTNGSQSDPSNPGYLQVTADISDQGASASNLTDAEVFLNTVKADGTGLQMLPVDGKLDSPAEKFYALIPLSQIKAYKDGTVTVYVHGRDAAGNWGDATANPSTILVDRIAPKLTGLTATLGPVGQPGVALSSALLEANGLAAAEVWTGRADPGVGKATAATLSVTNGQVTAQATLPTAAGTYQYNLRVRDQAGNWSNAVSTTLYVFASYLENTAGWPRTTGAATITTSAALPNPDEPTSRRGLQVAIATQARNRTGFLTDNAPVAAGAYHARFRMQLATLSTAANASNVVTVFDTRTANGANGGSEVFAVQMRTSGGQAQLRGAVGSTVGPWFTVGNTAHTISVDYRAGVLTLAVDAAANTVTTGSTATIEAAQLGVSNATVSASATGLAYFDSFFAVSSAS